MLRVSSRIVSYYVTNVTARVEGVDSCIVSYYVTNVTAHVEGVESYRKLLRDQCDCAC